MADKKISQLTTLAQADVAVTADFLPIVDTSATETKKATPQALVQAGATGATLPVALGAVGTPSYTFTGDLNTGLWSPAADTVAVSTGGSERLRVDSSGNLAIGTDTPGTALGRVFRINGASSGTNTGLIFSNALTDNATAYSSNTQFALGSLSAIPTVFVTNNTERMRLDSSGNLGIGTASPVFANGSGIEIERAGAATLRLQDSSTTNSFELYVDSNVHVRGRDSMATIFYTSDVERARITATGNIVAGASAALATNATNGFLYVPTCAGTPTGTPTAITGMAPIVVDTTNNKLYFYSGGQWRDAGP